MNSENVAAKIIGVISSGHGFRVKYGSRANTGWLTNKKNWVEALNPIMKFNDTVVFEVANKDGIAPSGNQKWRSGGKQYPFTMEEFNIVVNELEPMSNVGNKHSQQHQAYPYSHNYNGNQHLGGYPVPSTNPQVVSFEVDSMRQKITELTDEKRELKQDKRELRKAVEKLKEENGELKIELKTKDKEFELESAKSRYKSENSFSGILKTLADPNTAEGLAGYMSAVKDSKEGSQPSLGNAPMSDLKSALIGMVTNMTELEDNILWNTLNSEQWTEAIQKQKEQNQQ